MFFSGNATTAEGNPVDLVRIFQWPAGGLETVVTPDETGDWEVFLFWDGDYGVTYIADGCQPVTHGPYSVVDDFSPTKLFGDGVLGYWYEAKPEYLYQDAAGQTPVTASGQRVGLMLDISGNGYHASQPDINKRPRYYTNGIVSWLEFNGSSMYMIGSLAHQSSRTIAGSGSDFTGTEGVIIGGRSDTDLRSSLHIYSKDDGDFAGGAAGSSFANEFTSPIDLSAFSAIYMHDANNKWIKTKGEPLKHETHTEMTTPGDLPYIGAFNSSGNALLHYTGKLYCAIDIHKVIETVDVLRLEKYMYKLVKPTR